MKRRIKSQISLFLLLLTGIGLAISTLHSHHHLEWNHSKDSADTGHCISVDTTVCPISGYIFEKEVLSASHSGETFFDVTGVIFTGDFITPGRSVVISRGRSPPVKA